MNIYLQQLILSAAVVYIVDVSGFTTSWRSLVERWMNNALREKFHKKHPDRVYVYRELRALPPFDCGKCMTFWSCLALAAAQGQLSLLTFAASAGFALLSKSFSALMIFISETIEAALDKITPNR